MFIQKGLYSMLDIIVIGGGPAGMMAAIMAKREGHNVLLLERNDRLGRKLLATGNGRCNYTNVNLSIDNYHGENEKFAMSALSQFNVEMTMDFLEQLGITPSVDEGGKVFPFSYQSSSVLDVLTMELRKLKVDIEYDTLVKDISKNEDGFDIWTSKGNYIGDRVILTSGGLALPNSGSDGLGYSLVKDFGHRLTRTYPALVQLELEGDVYKPISGVKFLGEASLFIDGKFIKKDKGDILFTDYGISGPPILQLSRGAIGGLLDNRDVEIRVSILHGEDHSEVLNYLYYRFGLMGDKSVSEAMVGLINTKLIDPVLRESKINKNRYVSQIRSEEIERLARTLIDWRFKVSGNKSYKFAQVTAGGIETNHINNTTLESELVEGLYFAGEVLDVDGDCGGFNLQWAWSSGYIAGVNASK